MSILRKGLTCFLSSRLVDQCEYFQPPCNPLEVRRLPLLWLREQRSKYAADDHPLELHRAGARCKSDLLNLYADMPYLVSLLITSYVSRLGQVS